MGAFGVHRFSVGKIGTGALQLITLGGLGIWTLIDFVMILLGSFKDKQGQALARRSTTFRIAISPNLAGPGIWVRSRRGSSRQPRPP
ncbi:TM2 domain-containing protein [Streptosporangium canum]|uniref:TM2 domain-containing protein n=1 Tax=Streptosporangium canum TaxID=324952 RepID=UPI0036A83CE3